MAMTALALVACALAALLPHSRAAATPDRLKCHALASARQPCELRSGAEHLEVNAHSEPAHR
jgi:hypothetical protein